MVQMRVLFFAAIFLATATAKKCETESDAKEVMAKMSKECNSAGSNNEDLNKKLLKGDAKLTKEELKEMCNGMKDFKPSCYQKYADECPALVELFDKILEPLDKAIKKEGKNEVEECGAAEKTIKKLKEATKDSSFSGKTVLTGIIASAIVFM